MPFHTSQGLVYCLPDDPLAPPRELFRDSVPHIRHKLSPGLLLLAKQSP